MAYIGKQPIVGNFVKLDAITTSATTTFNLTNGGVAYYPQSANNCLVSLNGILQAPTDSYTISGSTIVFSSALTTSDVIDFIIVLGDVLNLGTPSDNTVSLAKLTATGTKDSTTFLRGDNTFATAGATAGQVIQVVTATDSTQRSTTSTSFVTGSNTLSVSITPASTSNKIFIICHSAISIAGAGYVWNGTIYRDSTNLGDATYGLGRFQMGSTGDRGSQMMFSYLDSPSSTSAITYQLYFKADGSTNYVNYAGTRGSITAFEIKG
jgi:hypothetical protein